MTTTYQESDSSIRLSSRVRTSEDSSTLCGSAVMEHSEPLLGDGSQDGRNEPQESPIWKRIPFMTSRKSRRRRKTDHKERDMLGSRKKPRTCLMLGVSFLAVLGVIQLLSLLGNLVMLAIPDRIHDITRSWGKPGHVGAGLAHWPTDFTRDILPIPCHSHNDYWRNVPFYSAIEAGCISIEADIWLYTDKLYVGHSVASLTPNRTLDSLYINPLLETLSKQNQKPLITSDPNQKLHGVFDTDPDQQIIFLIDFKTSGTVLFPHVVQALEPLRSKGYLTRRNGSELIQRPIIVVGTGGTPFGMVTSDADNPYHDIFFDAPLSEMYEAPGVEASKPGLSAEPQASSTNGESNSQRRHGGSAESGGKSIPTDAAVYNASNSFYASTSFIEAIGVLLDGEFSDHQMDLLRGQIRGAHRRGLKARYWELPFWPIHLRNHVWDVLVKEGVDLLNVDDLKGATKRDWTKNSGWW